MTRWNWDRRQYPEDKAHCDVAARMGNYLKFKVMGWPDPQTAALDAAMKEKL